MSPMHVMIDIEAMGLRPGCAVCEIAMVAFDAERVVMGVSYWLNPARQQHAFGLQVEVQTWNWWQDQPEAAREILERPRMGQTTIQPDMLADVMRSFFRAHRPIVWSRGPSYDLTVIAALLHRMGQDAPWDFKDERCVRTFTAGVPIPEFQGQRHNALYDAVHQVKHIHAAEKAFPGNFERMSLTREQIKQEIIHEKH